jgi:hypothetical protein
LPVDSNAISSIVKKLVGYYLRIVVLF